MSKGLARRYQIAIALSVAWLVGAIMLFGHARAVEVKRLARQCYQMQADARTSKLCAEANSVIDQPLCRFKDADCSRWPLEDAHYAENVAWFAVVPIVLAWVFGYGLVRLVRSRRSP